MGKVSKKYGYFSFRWPFDKRGSILEKQYGVRGVHHLAEIPLVFHEVIELRKGLIV